MTDQTTSVVPAVCETLKTQLTSALVGRGEGGKDPIVMESFAAEFSTWDTVIIGDQSDGQHIYHSIRAGRKVRQEVYLQHVWFRVIRSGTEATEARATAFAHLAVLEDLVAEDPSLGLGVPTLVANVAEFSCNTVHEGDGWLATMRADVAVSVRLV